ncbi:MAG: hypothetical protein KKH73_00695, partial [Actinobacteria bacterium]|nr:hypothetical protein [Actinomycetota bacterium]
SLDEFNCFLVGSYGYPTPVDKDNAYTSTLKVRDITIPPGTLGLLFRKEGQGDIVIPSMRITLIRSSE